MMMYVEFLSTIKFQPKVLIILLVDYNYNSSYIFVMRTEHNTFDILLKTPAKKIKFSHTTVV